MKKWEGVDLLYLVLETFEICDSYKKSKSKYDTRWIHKANISTSVKSVKGAKEICNLLIQQVSISSA